MKRRTVKRMVIVISLCCGMILGTWILNTQIRINREKRERYFVDIHCIAMQSVVDPVAEPPNTIHEMMEIYAGEGVGSVMLKPFRNGLTYQRTPRGFMISEPQREFVSLFRRDRLVATDRDWPHWESSGIKVWKFPGQQVPTNFLNTQEVEQDVRGDADPATR